MNAHQELVSIYLMAAFVTLWPLGGYRWKPFRRVILPLITFGLLYWYGLACWRSALAAGFLCFGSYLGYGENTPWFVPFQEVSGKRRGSKLLTALSFSFPAASIGLTWWIILAPMTFLATFFLSNQTKTSRDFPWKVCEAITGLTIAVSIIAALQRSW